MTTQRRDRLPVAVLLIGLGIALGAVLSRMPAAVRAGSAAAPLAPGALIPRFIDFDIGTAFISQGAGRPNEDLGFIYLPDSGQPRTSLHFTMPPDFSPGSEVSVRVLWAGETGSCAVVMGASLIGRGAQHAFPATGAYDTYWPGQQTASGTQSLPVAQAGQSLETIVTFRPMDGRPTHAGDAMRLLVYRDSGAPLDTCAASLVVQSVTVTYQGLTTYAPLIQR